MFQSIKIGRALGIDLFVHGTFWLLPAFVLLSGLLSGGPVMAALDTAVVLTIFGCVALHELGHAAAARLYGIRTRDIVLYPIGGVARLERMPERPLHEIVVALAGPAVNVAIVAFLAPLMLLDGYSLAPTGPFESLGEVFWTRVLWGNVGLVLFNLLPAFPMDGGRVLRAVLAVFAGRRAATDLAALVGAGFAGLFAIYGIVSFSPMLVVLAFFLYMAGRAERDAVRYGGEQARPRYADEAPYPEADAFARRPRRVLAHGWVYDAQAGEWVYYLDGYPVRRMPAG